MTNMNLETLGDSLDGYTTGTYWTVIVNTMQTAILKTHGLQKSYSGKPERIRIQIHAGI